MDDTDLRERLLAATWQEIRGVTTENIGNYPVAQRLIDAGADPATLATAMNAAAYEAVFVVLEMLSSQFTDDDHLDADTGWAVFPIALTADDEHITIIEDQNLYMLHEELLGADPTGNEGADLFE